MEFSPDQTAAYDAVAARLLTVGVDLAAETSTPQDTAADVTVASITGKAGSGKTVLLTRIAEALEAAGLEPIGGDYEPGRKRTRRSFAVLAPTNKAASVLRARGVQATTLHRIMYIPVYDPEYERIAQWLTEGGMRPEVEGVTEEMLDRAHAFYGLQKSIPGALAAAGLRGSDFIQGWKRRDDHLGVALVDEASMLDDKQFEDLKEIFCALFLVSRASWFLRTYGHRGAVGSI